VGFLFDNQDVVGSPYLILQVKMETLGVINSPERR